MRSMKLYPLKNNSLMRMAFIKSLAILALVGFLTTGNSRAADTHAGTPVLVELFTSEGCSSCPPADAWLQRMDAAQPLPGAELIVLSEHVDYWNHDGWKDPYSSSLVTERQSDYVRALGLQTPYTPQVIVDGVTDLHLTDDQQMEQTFQKAATSQKVPVRITSVTLDPANSSLLRAHVEVDGTSAGENADIYDAVALSHAESQVLHGENSGKHLTHVAVVQELTKIGKMQKGKTFSRDIEIKLKPGTDPKNIRLVVFAQKSGPGKVLGAALQENIQVATGPK
ncbi:MAG TPA: DUF1223 domain-containing protein [Terriglobales bacterium]